MAYRLASETLAAGVIRPDDHPLLTDKQIVESRVRLTNAIQQAIDDELNTISAINRLHGEPD